MTTRTIFFIFLILLLFNTCTEKKGVNSKDSNSVVGLLYLDEEPVSIEIVEGEIAKIKHLPSGSATPEVYVAPGLIDIQINGYMGIDFADQNLNIEGIREAAKGSLEGEVSPMVPASILRQHKTTWIFLDKESSLLLT